MKYEWKKHEKALYLPKAVPAPVTVPEHAFFMIRGEGNPNGEAFLEAIGVLYALSYAVKMLPKKGDAPEGYYEYAVFPLEGVWDTAEPMRPGEALNKDALRYTLMIRQPDFVTNSPSASSPRQAGKSRIPSMRRPLSGTGTMACVCKCFTSALTTTNP